MACIPAPAPPPWLSAESRPSLAALCPSDEEETIFERSALAPFSRVGIEPVQWLAAPCAIQGDFTVSSATHQRNDPPPVTPCSPPSRSPADGVLGHLQRGRVLAGERPCSSAAATLASTRDGKQVRIGFRRPLLGSAKEIVTACERPKGKAALRVSETTSGSGRRQEGRAICITPLLCMDVKPSTPPAASRISRTSSSIVLAARATQHAVADQEAIGLLRMACAPDYSPPRRDRTRR